MNDTLLLAVLLALTFALIAGVYKREIIKLKIQKVREKRRAKSKRKAKSKKTSKTKRISRRKSKK